MSHTNKRLRLELPTLDIGPRP